MDAGYYFQVMTGTLLNLALVVVEDWIWSNHTVDIIVEPAIRY